jgi:RNA polymerase-binding transcription factor DksA
MSERFTDQIDHANHLADLATQEAVAKWRKLAAPEQDPDNIDPDCADCGLPIEEGRLALLRCRCISCQSIKEKKDKQHARH